MRIEDSIEVHPNIAAQACHRFFYLHESPENLMAQLNISRRELEMILRKHKQMKLFKG